MLNSILAKSENFFLKNQNSFILQKHIFKYSPYLKRHITALAPLATSMAYAFIPFISVHISGKITNALLPMCKFMEELKSSLVMVSLQPANAVTVGISETSCIFIIL